MGKNSKRQELLSQDSFRVLQFSVQSLQKAALHPYCLDKLKTCAPTRISPQLGEELCRLVRCNLHPASNFAHMRSTTALYIKRATQQHTKTVPTRSSNSSFAHNMHSNLLSHCCHMRGKYSRSTCETWILHLCLISKSTLLCRCLKPVAVCAISVYFVGLLLMIPLLVLGSLVDLKSKPPLRLLYSLPTPVYSRTSQHNQSFPEGLVVWKQRYSLYPTFVWS